MFWKESCLASFGAAIIKKKSVMTNDQSKTRLNVEKFTFQLLQAPIKIIWTNMVLFVIYP